MALTGAGLLLLGFGLGYFVFGVDPPAPVPPAPVSTAPAATAPAATAPAATAPAATAPPPPAVPVTTVPAAVSKPTPSPVFITPAPELRGPAPGQLRIAFDHPLKAGTLRVWLDDELVIDERLTSWVEKKGLVFSRRRGNFSDELEVEPGWHDVKIQVEWVEEGKTNLRTARIRGQFRSGVTRTLDADLGRNLDLEWRR